ncbi:MAG: hypothetical protein ACM3N4_04405 [Nitrososphaerota archaeon]
MWKSSCASSGLPRAILVIPAFCVILAALAGCGATASATTDAVPTATRSAPSPTSAPVSAQQACQSALNGATLQPATAGAGFSDVSFPPNSLSTSITTSHGGSGRFAIRQFDVCSNASGADTIRSFFASGLPNTGWKQASTYPYDGAYQTSCGDPYCWRKGTAPRYVSLEKVTDRHNGYITYHVRLALPPTSPSCTPDPAGIYPTRSYDGASLPNTTAVPAPPLTKDGIGSAGTNGNVTQGGYGGECSAGAAAGINAFFTTELPALGWHHSAPPSSLAACGISGTQWWKGNEIFQWHTDGSAGASGTFWGYGDCTVS